MKQFFLGFLIFTLAVGTSPESIIRLDPSIDPAFARGGGRAGGFSRGGGHARPSGGARTRPSSGGRARPSSGARTRPATAQRPSTAQRPTKPVAGNPGRPAQKPATRPAAKPGKGGGLNQPHAGLPGAQRPPGTRPGAGNRPPGSRPPGAGNRPGAGQRPPGARPPGTGQRPPGYRPPHHRPPSYRPPYHRPPYYRPPHPRYGSYYWGPSWGWFFTAALVGSTLVYVNNLPSDNECQKVQSGDETLYSCNGVLYRSTYYQDEKVYEIVSDAPEEVTAEPTTVIGMELTDPMTRGVLVRDLQNRLVGVGYDVGGVDGVFGSGTQAAVEWFQYDNEFEVTGMVGEKTARALGFETGAPVDATNGQVDDANAPSDAATDQPDAVNE